MCFPLHHFILRLQDLGPRFGDLLLAFFQTRFQTVGHPSRMAPPGRSFQLLLDASQFPLECLLQLIALLHGKGRGRRIPGPRSIEACYTVRWILPGSYSPSSVG